MKKITTSLVASLLLATNLVANDELSSIYVTSATKSKQSIQDVTSNVNVITKEELEERHFTTVNEAINTLSGINVTTYGGMGKGASVYMRGFDTQRILVMIDGIRYNDFTGISGARFQHLMINDIEQIEVIKGAQSGVWGADATAGVINIITKKADYGFYSDAKVEYGSFNSKKIQTLVSHRDEKTEVRASLIKVTSDGFTTRATKGVDIDSYEDDSYENTTFNFNSAYNIDDKNRIDFKYNKIKTESEIDRSLSNQEGHKLYMDNDYSSLSYTNNNNFSEIKTYLNYTRIDRDDPTGTTKEFDGDLYEYGINMNVPYGKDSFVLVGSDYKVSEHKNDVNKTLENKGVFVTNSTKLGQTVLSQSLRYDTYDLYNNKTTGKVGAKYSFSNDLYVSSNIGTSYNVPNFYNLYDSFAGYDGLQPETTESFDLSFGYKDVKITYFHNNIDNMIDYNSNTNKYYNINGKVKLEGIEVDYKNAIMDDLLFALNYTYLKAKDNNGMDLQRRAEQSLKFGLDYYGIEKLHLNLNGEYIGDRVEYTWGTYNIDARTGNYTVFNTVANYNVNKKTDVYVKVDNIFDKYYQTIDGYATAPRSFYVGLKYKF